MSYYKRYGRKANIRRPYVSRDNRIARVQKNGTERRRIGGARRRLVCAPPVVCSGYSLKKYVYSEISTTYAYIHTYLSQCVKYTYTPTCIYIYTYKGSKIHVIKDIHTRLRAIRGSYTRFMGHTRTTE